jgi:hypothetical protein
MDTDRHRWDVGEFLRGSVLGLGGLRFLWLAPGVVGRGGEKRSFADRGIPKYNLGMRADDSLGLFARAQIATSLGDSFLAMTVWARLQAKPLVSQLR